MKLNRILTILALGIAFVLPTTSFAGKGKAKAGKGAGKGQRPGLVLQKYDTNKNGQIDGDEIDALKKAFAADPKGSLAVFDKNSNGTFEDDEITAINARMTKRAERVAKKGQKKNNNTNNNT